jgi:hypothetical protein
MRRAVSFLLLALLLVAAGAGAAVGATQAASGAPLSQAVANTLAAPNYTEVLSERTPQGNQVAHLVFHSPDRLGGYVQSGSRRTYIAIIGSTEYQSVTVSASHGPSHLTLYSQPSQGAVAIDPAHTYLPFYSKGTNVQKSGSTTTMTLTQGGQSDKLTFTVSGSYVSNFAATTPTGNLSLAISDVGTSPPVVLPANSRVVTVPPSSSP